MDKFLKFYCDRLIIGLVLFTVATIILIISDLLGCVQIF